MFSDWHCVSTIPCCAVSLLGAELRSFLVLGDTVWGDGKDAGRDTELVFVLHISVCREPSVGNY